MCVVLRAHKPRTDTLVGEEKADNKDDEKEIKGMCVIYTNSHVNFFADTLGSPGRQRHPDSQDIRMSFACIRGDALIQDLGTRPLCSTSQED